MRPTSIHPRTPSTTLALRAATVATVVALAGSLVLLSCSSDRADEASESAGVVVRSVTIDEPINGTSAAVRLEIDNTGGPTDRLVAVSSNAAARATLHRSTTDDQGRSAMEGLSGIDIPAGKEVRFEPGGLHVMLNDFRQPLEVGDVVDLTLTFQHGGTQTVDATVVPIGENGMDDMDHDMSHDTGDDMSDTGHDMSDMGR